MEEFHIEISWFTKIGGSNHRQRVLGNTNPVKLGRCFEFLNNYYGFHQGNGSNQHKQNEKLFNFAESDGFSTQKELSESYGITQQTMNNYMKMANMIPELEDLVDTGIVTKPFTPKYPSKRYW